MHKHSILIGLISVLVGQSGMSQSPTFAGSIPTTITITSGPNPAIFGRSVKLTATVAPLSASGKVTFYSGSAFLGVAKVTNGKALFATQLLMAGLNSLTAYYTGNPTYGPSRSTVLVQTVKTNPASGFLLPAMTYPCGQVPSGIAMADFNGDGNVDLAVASHGGNGVGGQVSILLGNGKGGFQAPSSYATDSISTAVVAADFNGDGKIDLAVANSSSDVSVLLGNGDGTFLAAVNFETGWHPSGLSVADFNQDGKADLVVADGNFAVRVLLGNGDGTFQKSVSYFAGDSPATVAVGDFNGDGKDDLAVADQGPGGGDFMSTISVLSGNGDGTFQSAVAFGAGLNPRFVITGDFNADGSPDLAVTNTEPQTKAGVTILTGDGKGGFTSSFIFSPDGFPYAIAQGDFNGDEKIDLVTANIGFGNNVSVFLGDGNGTFQRAFAYLSGNSPSAVIVGDFNRDGRADLAVANSGDNTISIFLGAPPARP